MKSKILGVIVATLTATFSLLSVKALAGPVHDACTQVSENGTCVIDEVYANYLEGPVAPVDGAIRVVETPAFGVMDSAFSVVCSKTSCTQAGVTDLTVYRQCREAGGSVKTCIDAAEL